VLDFDGNWEDHLPLVDFTYNNNYQAIIGMAPYEALYERRCCTPVCWEEVGDKRILIQIWYRLPLKGEDYKGKNKENLEKRKKLCK